VKRHRHTPEQAVRKVREGERLLNDGKDLAEVLRRLEISEATWNRWRAQYGGMKASQAKRLKELEAENARSSGWSLTRRWTSTCSRSWPRETSDPGAAPQGRGGPGGALRGL
jgi:putative transposase